MSQINNTVQKLELEIANLDSEIKNKKTLISDLKLQHESKLMTVRDTAVNEMKSYQGDINFTHGQLPSDIDVSINMIESELNKLN